MSTSACFITGAIWSGAAGVRLWVKKLVISEPSAASTRLLPAGVWSVSETGSACSSDAELRATSPLPLRSAAARGEHPCAWRTGRRVSLRAGQFRGHDPQPVEVVHVAGGGRHGADGDLRVGAGEPVGQVLLAGRDDHPLGVHPQRG